MILVYFIVLVRINIRTFTRSRHLEAIKKVAIMKAEAKKAEYPALEPKQTETTQAQINSDQSKSKIPSKKRAGIRLVKIKTKNEKRVERVDVNQEQDLKWLETFHGD